MSSSTSNDELHDLIRRLVARRSLPVQAVNAQLAAELIEYGFTAEPESIRVPEDVKPLDQGQIESQLTPSTHAWLQRLEIVPSIESTNTTLFERAQHESIHGHVLLAELQTQGRGRRGRRWISPYGRNVMVSIGLDLDVPMTQIGTISLMVGVVVALALEAAGAKSVQVKWPNDIYINGCKLGGILIDLLQATQPAQLLVGIGLNIERAPEQSPAMSVPAISLGHVVTEPSRNKVVGLLLNELVAGLERFSRLGFAPFRSAWLQRDAFAGQMVRVQGLKEDIEGRNRGIDQTGALCIETQAGMKRIIGGDVSLRTL